VLTALDRAVEQLAALGAIVEEISFPDMELFTACGRVIMTAEAYAIHEEDLRRRPTDFARYTYQRIVLGAALSAADYMQALRLRRELCNEVNGGILTRYDALVCAAALRPAVRLDSFPPDWPLGISLQTIAYNVIGNPALVLPVGYSASGLPFGMQIVGRWFDEPTVLRIGRAFEIASRTLKRRPGVAMINADGTDRALTVANVRTQDTERVVSRHLLSRP
jgi:aspartyl-tRNA(Asn)/glutamyl-tRNA(Gln) amidotransferase subunit A